MMSFAVLGLLKQRRKNACRDPWGDLSAWRIGGSDAETFKFKDETGEYVVSVSYPEGYAHPHVLLPGGKEVRLDADAADVAVDRHGAQVMVMYHGHDEELVYLDPLYVGETEDSSAGKLTAPMPGKVVAVHAKAGGTVKKGQPLVIVEAMKMEHTIIAPFDGIISTVHAAVGDQVDEKRELVAFK